MVLQGFLYTVSHEDCIRYFLHGFYIALYLFAMFGKIDWYK